MKILIIGAGISGLSLAYFLQQGKTSKNLEILVLERDNEFESSRQGFSLTLQAKTQDILSEYGLLNDILTFGHRSKRQLFFNGLNGKLLHENTTNDQDRFNYPAPRQSIRKLFYDRLKPDTVLFGAKVININSVENTVYILKDNEDESDKTLKYNYDYLIACDGVNSTVRNLVLPNIKINDLSLCNVYGLARLDLLANNSKQLFNNSEVQILDGCHRFFSKPFNSKKQMWELTWPTTDFFKDIYNRLNKGEDVKKQALLKCLEVVSKWNNISLNNSDKEETNEHINSVYSLIDITNVEDIIVHPLYDIDPLTIDFSNVPNNIIFVGDSIHAMSPYIGMGANEAIHDSFMLAQVFNTEMTDKCAVEDLLVVFHRNMVSETRKSVLRSRENTMFYHSKDAIDKDKLYAFKKW